ncbi:rod shape-determining protein [Novosphingobium sp. M1R2S20]|uniref:Cell shape-determining protein MreB n=1 Tax=Novosphingobium rhizovicinum TaxID=3228928 RepID=A0ABV3REC5_9SPHN
MKRLFSWSARPQLAFDVGTANIRVISAADGVLLDEPSVCCFDHRATPSTLIAAGAEAQLMLDRTPQGLKVQRPLYRGVLQDLEAACALLTYARRQVVGRSRLRAGPTLIGIPADATEVERRALLTAAEEGGFGRVRLVSEPMAAAIGAGLPIAEARASMLIECGAGTTEVVVISLGGVAVRKTVRVGGDALDRAISDHVHMEHRVTIGAQTARRVKLELSATGTDDAASLVSLKGRRLGSGLPTVLTLPSSDFDPVVRKHARPIIEAVKDCLAQTPPELSHDVCEFGVTLTGGSAYLPWLGAMITDLSGLEVRVAEHAEHCVARGLQQMLH